MTEPININVVEGQWVELDITDAHASQLAHLGRDLASRERYWRTTSDKPSSTSVIQVSRSHSAWRLRVPGAVGSIRVGGMQIAVSPKIPITQFVPLLIRSDGTGRTVPGDVSTMSGDALWELLAGWFIADTRTLVEHELLRDYVEHERELQLARGSIEMLATARSVASGRLAVTCRFEEFELDTPLNRMVRAGLVVVSRSQSPALRAHAARLLGSFREVGAVREADWRTEIDRRAFVYRHTVRLARELVLGSARSLGAGGEHAQCFLIPSARVFEDGVRSILADHLAGIATVTRGRFLSATGNVAFDPDLVIRAVDESLPRIADVKYRSFGLDWPSDVRNQAIAFAMSAGAHKAGVIGIEATEGSSPSSFSLSGPPALDVLPLLWRSWHSAPEDALRSDVDSWLGRPPSPANSVGMH